MDRYYSLISSIAAAANKAWRCLTGKVSAIGFKTFTLPNDFLGAELGIGTEFPCYPVDLVNQAVSGGAQCQGLYEGIDGYDLKLADEI
ncbi:hypothetical protein V2G26_005084 [Clonostachys chloroleuca]